MFAHMTKQQLMIRISKPAVHANAIQGKDTKQGLNFDKNGEG